MWSTGSLSCDNSIGQVHSPSNSLELTSLTGLIFLAQTFTAESFLLPIPSSISMNGVSFNWYMPLTPFESIFLSMIMIQIFVLRWLDILPININNVLHGDPSGRKKRELKSRVCGIKDNVTESVFNLVKKLDREECFLRTICQLQSQTLSQNEFDYPEETKRTLEGIRLFGELNKDSCSQNTTTNSSEAVTNANGNGIEAFEEALEIGSKRNFIHSRNTTNCEVKYKLCPLNSADITHYAKIILNSY